jgi:predicted dehydrogenase
MTPRATLGHNASVTEPSPPTSDTDHREIRWGIVGPGRIAAKVVGDFVHVPGAEIVAVASRSLDRAQTFATAHGVLRAYGSYREIIADPDIDVLYIATPHPQHHAIALAAIEAGKALLVEKSFTATAAGAREIVQAARTNGVFVMEAMWTRFQPVIVAVRQLIADGAIGEVRAVQADLGVGRDFDPTDRLFDPAQGGGAMLDLGVYVVSFTQMLLGTPTSVTARGSLAPSGVDQEAGILLGYDDGRSGALTISIRNQSPGSARIFGTAGWIDVAPRFHHPTTIVMTRSGHEPETITRPVAGGGYAHELIEVTDCVLDGRTESAVMPLQDTLDVQGVLEEAGRQLGATYSEDPGR